VRHFLPSCRSRSSRSRQSASRIPAVGKCIRRWMRNSHPKLQFSHRTGVAGNETGSQLDASNKLSHRRHINLKSIKFHLFIFLSCARMFSFANSSVQVSGPGSLLRQRQRPRKKNAPPEICGLHIHLFPSSIPCLFLPLHLPPTPSLPVCLPVFQIAESRKIRKEHFDGNAFSGKYSRLFRLRTGAFPT